MEELIAFTKEKYVTPEMPRPLMARISPSFYFYCHLFHVVYQASRMVVRGVYRDDDWAVSSFRLLQFIERAGVTVEITGTEHIRNLQGPCLFIGNHMSLMETILLPAVIQPIRPVTYVIKESLLEYPVFRHVMRSRNPIAVTRTNPRHDLKVVMEEGSKRLSDGISLIIFPQTTRSHTFDPSQMSSIGVKLAKSAGVPVIPLALRTDAMHNGKMIKDLGKIDTQRKVYFAFSEPLIVSGKGVEEQRLINDFITKKLLDWQHDVPVLTGN